MLELKMTSQVLGSLVPGALSNKASGSLPPGAFSSLLTPASPISLVPSIIFLQVLSLYWNRHIYHIKQALLLSHLTPPPLPSFPTCSPFPFW